MHACCLLVGAAGLGSLPLIASPGGLLLPMLLLGVAWASIITLPIAMLMRALPGDSGGESTGVMNTFIVVPEMVFSTAVPALVGWWLDTHQLPVVAAGGVCAAAAAALSWEVLAASLRS